MPSRSELAARGGLVRVRTKRLPDGRYVRIYVVRKKGRKGGRTIAGEVKRTS